MCLFRYYTNQINIHVINGDKDKKINQNYLNYVIQFLIFLIRDS